jgi:uncharacterized membrane protein (UPF0182 family)
MTFADPRRRGGRFPGKWLLILLALGLGLRWLASVTIQYQWWKEVEQLETWFEMLGYGVVPVVLAGILTFAVLWVAHARALVYAGTRLRAHPLYAAVSTFAVLLLAALITAAAVDSWTVVRWAGGLGLPDTGWTDPVFGRSLGFYFFDLPFYRLVLGFVLALTVGAGFLYWIAARGWIVKSQVEETTAAGGAPAIDLADLNLSAALETRFLRVAGAIALVALAGRFYLDRYGLLFADHGSLVGIDWVAENLTLPMLWLCVLASVAAAAALLAGRPKWALVLPAVWLATSLAPRAVTSLYVRPSEITIQGSYIDRHIKATRAAWGLVERSREVDFPAQLEAPIDRNKHRALFDNVRLWDWRAFHDTVTQIQALRPYYVFQDSDVGRYQIDGQLRQVMLTPRELDVQQLPADARARWINPRFIYTHGYGIVMAEAARITDTGLPVLMVQDAPPKVATRSLKITRPEIYYGEALHQPVFVRTAQPEFSYPSGDQNVETRYAGQGGFPVSSLPMRLAAAVSTGEWNILLTRYLQPESRMMIRRKVLDRLRAIAGFLHWDEDPYLVLTEAGHLVWIVDGYTTSNAHPYSRGLMLAGAGPVNYIRNSVKATIDAYDGTVRLYAFDAQDPILAAYRRLFPRLVQDAAAMPADLRPHTRYPERLFRLQAEIYRTYHMTDPTAFFNKEDVWDLSRNLNDPSGRPAPAAPAYVVATLPGSNRPEFLLLTTFTPRNKDNLIGLMVARCDGEALGELLFLQLSKQELIFGPMQIEARINQDQIISKDLTLWNQQGSQVLRGQMLVLPVENTLIYIEPIYIQAAQARMPQLKKVVIAMGNRLIYADSYEEAVQRLTGQEAPAAPARPELRAAGQKAAEEPPQTAVPDLSGQALERARQILRRYREFMSQGRYADAGREMEALEKAVGDQNQRR